ncbi:MAG: vitamin K epoxide reductase family protein [Planctomycetota bacterium]
MGNPSLPPTPTSPSPEAPAPTPGAPSRRPATCRRGARWWVAAVLGTLALLMTGYLTAESLAGDGRPAGCGGETGCAAVLTSKWSAVLGVPVGVLAAGVYGVLLVSLLWRRRVGGVVQAASAAAVLGAGLWFTYVQLAEVRSLCVYCTATHAVGLVVALTVFSGTAVKHLMPGVVAGAVGVAGLAAVQFEASDPVFVVDQGGGERAGSVLTLLGGRLTLDLEREMVLGDPNGSRVLVKLYDYNCPHCRRAYLATREIPGVTLVLVPVPLNPRCNAYLTSLPTPTMSESCDLARYALAVHRADPAKLRVYDDWAYGESWPRTAEAGRRFASSLVGPDALAAALRDPTIDAELRRNTEAWGQARDAGLVGGLPVHLAPGGGLTYGGVGDGTGLRQLLDRTHPSQLPHDPPAAFPEPAP